MSAAEQEAALLEALKLLRRCQKALTRHRAPYVKTSVAAFLAKFPEEK